MAALRRIAAAASWAACGTMVVWTLLVYARLWWGGLPTSSLADFAAWLRSIEPRWLWSADRSLIWYELLCAGILSLWLSSRRADRPGMYLGGGFWLAVLNPFWPLLAMAVIGLLALRYSHRPP